MSLPKSRLSHICVHCDTHVEKRVGFNYPISRELAHVSCVSQPSLHEMDMLLVEAQEKEVLAELHKTY